MEPLTVKGGKDHIGKQDPVLAGFLLVEFRGATYCGEFGCTGKHCGYPAAYVDCEHGRMFMRGSIVAVGPVMQRIKVHSEGEIFDLGSILTEDEVSRLVTMMWR